MLLWSGRDGHRPNEQRKTSVFRARSISNAIKKKCQEINHQKRTQLKIEIEYFILDDRKGMHQFQPWMRLRNIVCRATGCEYKQLKWESFLCDSCQATMARHRATQQINHARDMSTRKRCTDSGAASEMATARTFSILKLLLLLLLLLVLCFAIIIFYIACCNVCASAQSICLYTKRSQYL